MPESGKSKEVNIPRQDSGQRNISYRDIRRNVLLKFKGICKKTPCWCPPGWTPTWRTETNRNICYLVLLQKREFIPRGTQKHQSNTFSNTLAV